MASGTALYSSAASGVDRRDGKYRWHGSAEAYTGREVQDIPGVLAVFAERRKDSFGPYVRLMSVTLN
nr:DUF987 family protein [Escherichia coli]